jgi:hypothetical protein
MVKGYLSTVKCFHRDSDKVRSHPVINIMLEGMNVSRPMTREGWPSYDLPIVLQKLNHRPYGPIQSASLRDVAKKTLLVLAVASGRGCSELHAFSVAEHMVFSKAGVTLFFRPCF